MGGHWPRSFFAFLWTSASSRSIKTQNNNLANIQPSWLHAWSIMHLYQVQDNGSDSTTICYKCLAASEAQSSKCSIFCCTFLKAGFQTIAMISKRKDHIEYTDHTETIVQRSLGNCLGIEKIALFITNSTSEVHLLEYHRWVHHNRLQIRSTGTHKNNHR